ncbi:MAG: hypothetical protein AB7O32_05035 [Vicinamibacterales bacterium]
MDVEAATKRVRAEFEEMPGLALTVPQASKLFGLERDVCRHAIDRLIGTAYLRTTRSGAVTRGDR